MAPNILFCCTCVCICVCAGQLQFSIVVNKLTFSLCFWWYYDSWLVHTCHNVSLYSLMYRYNIFHFQWNSSTSWGYLSSNPFQSVLLFELTTNIVSEMLISGAFFSHLGWSLNEVLLTTAIKRQHLTHTDWSCYKDHFTCILYMWWFELKKSSNFFDLSSMHT